MNHQWHWVTNVEGKNYIEIKDRKNQETILQIELPSVWRSNTYTTSIDKDGVQVVTYDIMNSTTKRTINKILPNKNNQLQNRNGHRRSRSDNINININNAFRRNNNFDNIPNNNSNNINLNNNTRQNNINNINTNYSNLNGNNNNNFILI